MELILSDACWREKLPAMKFMAAQLFALPHSQSISCHPGLPIAEAVSRARNVRLWAADKL